MAVRQPPDSPSDAEWRKPPGFGTSTALGITRTGRRLLPHGVSGGKMRATPDCLAAAARRNDVASRWKGQLFGTAEW